MLLISILDRQLYVSTGKRAVKLLSEDQIDIIIEEIKPYIQKKDYDQGVELAIFRMGEVFSSEACPHALNKLWFHHPLCAVDHYCTVHFVPAKTE